MQTGQKPVIIQFDAEEFYRAALELILFNAGLELAAYAYNRASAINLAKRIETGEIKPDLAIVDSMLENEHHEGEQIATKLRKLAPKIKIIAYTTIEEQPWADYVAVKSGKNPSQTLAKGLEELLGIQLHPSSEVH